MISGLASIGGPPIVVYLLALGHTTARMRATSIVYFMLSGCVSLIPMGLRGLITRDILIWALVSLPVLFGGSRLVDKIQRIEPSIYPLAIDLAGDSPGRIDASVGIGPVGTLAFYRAGPKHHRFVALVTLSALAALLIGRALLG